MKIAILGTVHQKGLEFLKENKLEIVEVTNFNNQNLQEELNKASYKDKYDYKLENSITNDDSQIIIVDFKK